MQHFNSCVVALMLPSFMRVQSRLAQKFGADGAGAHEHTGDHLYQLVQLTLHMLRPAVPAAVQVL
jgi:hypothetical protein